MDETTPQKYTIAHFAAQNGNLDIVKYVVEKDASVLTRKVEELSWGETVKKTIAQIATEARKWNVLLYVIEKDASLLASKDENFGDNILHQAVRRGIDMETNKILVEENVYY